MHSFIFNSSKIFKILLIFLLLYIFYNIYLVLCVPAAYSFQNQWQKNNSIAQDFIYGDKKPHIIVGSSLSARLNKKILSNKYYNLSFSGGSVLTGLELVKRSGYIPETIYIESNFIFRGKSTQMLDTLFYPYWWKVKKYIPALREKYQLLNVLYAKRLCTKIKSNKNGTKKKRSTWKKPKGLDKIKSSKKFQIMIKRQLDKSKEKLIYKNQLADLKSLVKYFESNGTKIIFYEMPIDIKLAKTKKFIKRHNILKNTFQNDWLNLPNHKKYNTSDGLHLVPYSAWQMTKEFVENIKNPSKIKNEK